MHPKLNYLPKSYSEFIRQLIKTVLFRLQSSTGLLIFISIILLILEMMIPELFKGLIGLQYNGRNMLHAIFFLGCSILFLLTLPLFINQALYKVKLIHFGFSFPKNILESILLIILALIITIPSMIYVAKLPAFQNYYSLNKPGADKLLFAMFFILPIYYFCEEFFFRGFLFLTLWNKVKWRGLWVTDILFTLGHIGKPWLEVLMAFPIGIILALLTLRTKSIYPSMFVHYMLGITMLLVVNHML